jgi:hypothetical protein
MMFRRGAYEAIGGHSGAKDDLLEDIALSRLVDRHGLRAGLLLADGLVTCHMYRTWQDFRKVIDQLIKAVKADPKNFPYKTWGFDSITAIFYDLIMPKVTGSKEAQPRIQDWGEANRILLKFMSDVMTLNAYGINTIFLGHVQEEKEIIDEDKGTYVIHIKLAGSPQGRNEILRTVGTVGYYDWDRRFQNRELRFKPERKIDAPKFRQPKTGPQVPDKLVNPTMGDLFQYARRGK